MDLHKHDREKATDHIGPLRDADVSEEFGGRFGARFRSVFAALRELRRWIRSRTSVFRVVDPSWSGVLPAGTIRELKHTGTVITGNRLDTDLRYICNRPGLYHVSALFSAELTTGSVEHPRLALLVDGLFYSWLDLEPGTRQHWVLQGSDLVPLDCGQRLGIGFVYQPGGLASLNWHTGIVASYGYFGAHWEAPVCGLVDAAASIDTLPANFGDLTAGGGS